MPALVLDVILGLVICAAALGCRALETLYGAGYSFSDG